MLFFFCCFPFPRRSVLSNSFVMYGDEQLKGPGMSLTLLHTEDFSKKKAVMAKARSCSEVLKSGCTYSCSESYGGNSLTRTVLWRVFLLVPNLIYLFFPIFTRELVSANLQKIEHSGLFQAWY